MYCNNCGKRMSEGEKYCPNCGTKKEICTNQQLEPKGHIKLEDKLSTSSIIALAVSVAMILSMLILPMLELDYDKMKEYNNTYIISLLGDNYMAGYGVRHEIVKVSRIAFICMFVSIITINACMITKKICLGNVMAFINIVILLMYNWYVSTAWMNSASIYDEHNVVAREGIVLCLICAIVLLVISFYRFLNVKSKVNN